MLAKDTYRELNRTKANLNHIYNQSDPRAYFRELRKLDYAIPGSAKPLFERLIERLGRDRQAPIRVLDLGCSYGVNAALLKHDLTMRDLYEHWASDELAEAGRDEVMDADRRFFDGEGGAEVEVIGLDNAENAISYAEEAGLIDSGIATNLEVAPLPAGTVPELAPVDLVTSTGCIGYITEKSFEQLLPTITRGQAPWMANFVLRMFPFDEIESALADWGYVTEKLQGRTFIQRQFASAEEQDGVLRQLREQGIDAAGKEEDGHLHAEFFLSRPAEEAERAPLPRLLSN